jgi:hypothetical protein
LGFYLAVGLVWFGFFFFVFWVEDQIRVVKLRPCLVFLGFGFLGMGSGIMGGGSEGEKEGERHVALSLKPPLSPLRVRASRHGNLHVEVSRLGHTNTTLHDPSPLYSPCASPFAPDLSVPEVGFFFFFFFYFSPLGFFFCGC